LGEEVAGRDSEAAVRGELASGSCHVFPRTVRGADMPCTVPAHRSLFKLRLDLRSSAENGEPSLIIPLSRTLSLIIRKLTGPPNSVAPFKKDVTAKLYGGDVTRKVGHFELSYPHCLSSCIDPRCFPDETVSETEDG
jgi:hypothetical protein